MRSSLHICFRQFPVVIRRHRKHLPEFPGIVIMEKIHEQIRSETDQLFFGKILIDRRVPDGVIPLDVQHTGLLQEFIVHFPDERVKYGLFAFKVFIQGRGFDSDPFSDFTDKDIGIAFFREQRQRLIQNPAFSIHTFPSYDS